MDVSGAMPDYAGDALEAKCDAVLLGRLGRELAYIYEDTLRAPVPSRLQALVDRLVDSDHAASRIAESRR